MIRLGSKSISCRCLCISVYRIVRHSVCGIDGYKLSTSIVTSMQSLGRWRSWSFVTSEVELCR